MKNIVSLLLALIMAFAVVMLVACGDQGDEPGTPGGGDKSQVRLESGNVMAEGTFDEGVTLSADKVDRADPNYAAAISCVADKGYDEDKVAVYDISLVKESAKVQPGGKVKITMPAPFESGDGYVTYHIRGDHAEELATTCSSGKISFETEGFSYFVIAGKADENAPTYTFADKNGKEDANGDYVLFGTYPQTEMKDSAIRSALAEKAGELPQNGKNGKWTSYRYPYGKETSGSREMSDEIDFMWYIDIEYDGDLYRGVYFTYYRPNVALNVLQDDSAGYIYSEQKDNGYKIGNLYWFRHEPILWQIIRRREGKAQLLCMTALDSQAYTLLIEKSKDRFEDALDSHYLYYNATPGIPQNTLATNYKYSAIREWLNNDFYKNAFNAKQKKLICETMLDNVTGDVGNHTTDKVFIPSMAELEGVSDLYRKASDYSKSQGIITSYPGISCYYWYTRDTYYVLRFNDKKNLLSYDSDRYRYVCAVTDGELIHATNAPGFSGVTATCNGVVPSLWITL